MKDLLKVIMSRRSIRRYTGCPLSNEEIHPLVEAAQSAPSSFNRQQVRFLVIRNDRFKAAIGPPKATVWQQRPLPIISPDSN